VRNEEKIERFNNVNILNLSIFPSFLTRLFTLHVQALPFQRFHLAPSGYKPRLLQSSPAAVCEKDVDKPRV
jgi:hypothetical protein